MANFYSSAIIPENNIIVDSLTIESMPSKTTYMIGDTLDTTGLIVTAISNEMMTGDVTNYCSFSPLKLEVVGTQPIHIYYGGVSTSFNVIVKT